MSGSKIVIQAKIPAGEFNDLNLDNSGLLKTTSTISDGTTSATITDVGGKKALDVNVVALTLTADDDKIETRQMAMAMIVDEVSSAITYVGEALPGALTASAVWRIKKITTSGGVITITWADSNANFDNIWNNRAALTYG